MLQNLGELLLESSSRYGDEVAFQIRRGFRLERVTFREASERARQVAAWLLASGLVPGDRIIVWSPNMPEYAVLYFGAWLAGIVVVPVDVRTKQDVLDRFVAAAAPRLGLKSRSLDGSFAPPVATTVALEDLFELAATTAPLALPPAVRPDELCEIAFTSGTTGEPKGVMLTHGNLLAALAGLRLGFPLKRSYRALSVLPLSHALEQVSTLLLAYSFGVRVTYVPRLNAVTIARALREDEITCLVLVPELLRLLLAAIERRARQQGSQTYWDFAHRVAGALPWPVRRLLFRRVHAGLGGHLQFFGCGGAPLDLKLALAWERMGLRIFEGYGLTETSAASTINNCAAHRLGSVGKPLPGVEVQIAADGEVWIRGPSVTPGYFQAPERTERAFVDGWFRTGDIGAIDSDGFLHILGREAFKIVLPDGRKVYPEDIERALNLHPLVHDSCVIGLERDGRETVHAVLLTSAPERAAAIVRDANRRLGAHQQIAGYSIWATEDFPRTASLKADRKRVREAVEQQGEPTDARARPSLPAHATSAAEPAPSGEPLAALVTSVAKQPGANVRDAAELEADLGLDSIGRVELLSAIEDELGRVVDETRLGPQTTVGELRQLVREGTTSDGGSMAISTWPRSRWARGVGRGLQWLAFRLQDRWMRIEVVHPERAAALPLPSILIFNYQGPYVPLAILRAIPRRLRSRVAIAATARLWHGPDRWQGLLIALGAQAFPFVTSGGAVRSSLVELGRWLDDGYAVILSPEGGPERDGQLRPFLGGVGLMAVEMHVPVVPFKIDDYYQLFPRDPSFPYLPHKRGRVRLIIGEPVTFSKTLSHREATEQARQALLETH